MASATCTVESGTCAECQRACDRKPGWFAPGEAERAAEAQGLSLKEFFDNFLAVDYIIGDEEGWDHDVFVLSPAVVGADTGDMFPADPAGTCVFFTNGRCDIHTVKPKECREYVCNDESSTPVRDHVRVGQMWDTPEHQQQIRDLLGEEPVAQRWHGGGLFGLAYSMMFGGSRYDDEDYDEYEEA